MAKETHIQWAHATWNPIWGCQKVSPGCANCYAETLAKRYGHDVWGPGTERRTFSDAHWREPLKWDREAAAAGTRKRVFCASMGDVFEDHPTVRDQLPRLWDMIRRTPNLDWLLLTKRAHRIKRSLPLDWGPSYHNVWLGVSCENQDCAADRIPYLLDVPAQVRFLSCEPLLAPLDLSPYLNGLHWVIVGGESGQHFRAMDKAWAIKIRQDCQRFGVPFFFKQASHRFPGRDAELDGVEYHEFPVVA